MEIFCLEVFKEEYEKLISKKNYVIVKQKIIDYFFDKSIDDLLSGTRLNNSNITPYIKKRLGGRGGFRIYFLLLIKDECLYLMFLHPKTGSMGAETIDDDSKAYLYKKVLASIKNKDLFSLTLDETKSNIIFSRVNK